MSIVPQNETEPGPNADFEPFFEKLGSPEPLSADTMPKVLYHMTDTAGFEAIIKSRSLRAGLSTVLNDGLETKHGLSLFRKTLQRTAAGRILGVKRAFPKLPSTFESTLLSILELRRPSRLTAETFVFSLCRTKKTSGTWLHYGRKGKGVAIGFGFQMEQMPTNSLTQWWLPAEGSLAGAIYRQQMSDASKEAEHASLSRADVRLIKIEYDPLKQQERVEQFLKLSSEKAAELELAFDQDRSKDETRFLSHCLSAMQRICAQMKHPSFKEEREYRLVVEGAGWMFETQKENTGFRTNPETGTTVPYVLLPFQASELKSVTLGYSSPLDTVATQLFLGSEGMASEVFVGRSGVPIRP